MEEGEEEEGGEVEGVTFNHLLTNTLVMKNSLVTFLTGVSIHAEAVGEGRQGQIAPQLSREPAGTPPLLSQPSPTASA